MVAGNRCFVLQIGRDAFAAHLLSNPRAIAWLTWPDERARAQPVDAAAAGTAPGPEDLPPSVRTEEPGKILAVNFGITQIRFGVHDTQDESLNVRGVVEHGNGSGARIRLTAGGVATTLARPAFAPARFFDEMFEALRTLDARYQFPAQDVIAVGHRVAHGGSKFSSAAVITPAVIADIEALAVFAPQHSPVNLDGIREAMKAFPAIPHVAVFDTAFHQTLPTFAYLYGLPYDYYKKEGIRRYGFHGTSHRYVSLKAAEIVRRPLGEPRSSPATSASAPRCARSTTAAASIVDGHDAVGRAHHRQPRRQPRPGGDDPPDAALSGWDEPRTSSTRKAASRAFPASRPTSARSRPPPTRGITGRCSRAQGVLLPDLQEHRRLRGRDGRRRHPGLHRQHRRDQPHGAQPRLPGPRLDGHQARRGQEPQPGPAGIAR
ncbi:MAG: hypothetical protein IPJ62_06840 [Betaproteobacteria bacterium]|nr:hypothetical protein [Betaproteobacteria bacterium]